MIAIESQILDGLTDVVKAVRRQKTALASQARRMSLVRPEKAFSLKVATAIRQWETQYLQKHTSIGRVLFSEGQRFLEVQRAKKEVKKAYYDIPESLRAVLERAFTISPQLSGLVVASLDSLESIFNLSVTNLQKSLGLKAAFQLRDSDILSALEERANFMADSVSATTFERLKGRLAVSYFVEGKHPTLPTTDPITGQRLTSVAEDIRDFFDGNVARSNMVARTETAWVSSKAEFDYNQRIGIRKHGWMTARYSDTPPRPSHQLNDGVEVEIGEPFPNGQVRVGEGEADQVINCRCTNYSVYIPGTKLSVWDGSETKKAWSDEAREASAAARSLRFSTGRLNVAVEEEESRLFFSARLKSSGNWLPVSKEPVAEVTIDYIESENILYLNRLDAWVSGKGYGPELLSSAVVYASHKFGAHKVRAYVEVGNVNSQSMLSELGFAKVEEKKEGAYWERPVKGFTIKAWSPEAREAAAAARRGDSNVKNVSIKIGKGVPQSLVKVVQKYDFVTEVVNEGETEGHQNYWVYLKPGYVDKETGVGSIHEYTVEDVRKHLDWVGLEKEKAWSDEARAASAEARRGKPKPTRYTDRRLWKESLTLKEKEAILQFSGREHSAMNHFVDDMASGKISVKDLRERKVLRIMRQKVANFQSAIERGPVDTASKVLYRGLMFRSDEIDRFQKYASMVPGQEFTAKHFISTSPDLKVATKFMSKEVSSVLLEIRKSKTAVSIEDFAYEPRERERVFLRGTTFVVDSIKVNPADPDIGTNATVRLTVYEK